MHRKAGALLIILAVLYGCTWDRGLRRDRQETPVAYIQHEYGDTAVGPEIGFSLALWPGFRRAACSLTFDDGTLDQYLLAFPELERRGLKGTFFLITRYTSTGRWDDQEDTRKLINWDQARVLHQAGHEIGSHGRTHADFSAPGTNVRFELLGSYLRLKRELEQDGGYTLAWTYWRSNPAARSLAARLYLGARGGAGVLEKYMQSGHTYPYRQGFDYYQVGSLGMRNREYAKPWREGGDRIFAEEGWLVLCFHGFTDGTLEPALLGWEPLHLERFRAILDYVESRGFWVAPFGTVVRYARQRELASLRVVESMERAVVMTLEDGLDDRVFDQQLSIQVNLPPDWTRVEVVQHNSPLPLETIPEGVRFDALPDGSAIVLRRIDR
ncbi:MAG: polysaccharide deacetylase family protein [Spirochaetota bacterium]